jgi:hypothetical protein
MSLRAATVLLLATLAAAPAPGAVVEGLYDVGVPVADQGQAQRRDAIRAALLEMLSRATGLVDVPRNEAVQEALAAPGSYYVQYRYEREDAEEGPALTLVVSFAPGAITRLVNAAGLPLWSANRPTVVTWLVTDEGELLGAASDHPVLEGLSAQARRRGLRLLVPLMDLEDQLAVPPAAVRGGLAQVLEQASIRYAADTLLIARIEGADGEGPWRAEWEFWLRDAELESVVTDVDPLAVGRAGADLVADELAARYAVFGGELGVLKLEVGAVDSLADYGGLLEYLDSLEYIDSVQVREVTMGTIALDLVTSTQWARFVELLALDGLLTPVPQAIGAERRLLAWRGGADER